MTCRSVDNKEVLSISRLSWHIHMIFTVASISQSEGANGGQHFNAMCYLWCFRQTHYDISVSNDHSWRALCRQMVPLHSDKIHTYTTELACGLISLLSIVCIYI